MYPKKIEKVVWICSLCGSEYGSKYDADQCCTRGLSSTLLGIPGLP